MDHIQKFDTAIRTLMRVLSFDEQDTPQPLGGGRTGMLDTEVLALVNENPNIQATELIKILKLKPTTMQSVIDRLVRRKLIKKDADILKGRSVALSLSEDGANLYEQLHQRDLQNCAMMLSVLDPADRDKFVENISEMAAAVGAIAKANGVEKATT